MDTKVCCKCKREFPATTEHFWNDKRASSGLWPRCKECSKEDRNTKVEKKIAKDGYKFCPKCKKELPATTEFFQRNNRKKLGLEGRCKECTKEYEHSEKRQLYKKEWFKRHPEFNKEQWKKNRRKPIPKIKARLYQVQRDYGITGEDLVNKMNDQKGCCEICGDSLVFPNSRRSFIVDHNHDTGEVRGLLCNECNTMLGNIKENKNTLLNAIKYLEKYNG